MSTQQQRYRVIERVASGGMAEVFRAESAGLEGFKKTVAIKRVLPHLSEKKQFIGMFLDEARLSAHLSHSNCVQVFDIGVGDNTYFIVMEFVDGSDLKAIVEFLEAKRQRIPVSAAIHICCRICEGLAYAHEARDERGRLLGIVHRDISPPNVLITRHGEVKVVDFGLAKANSQLEHSQPGIIKGKFGYLSPEAALGESVDLRTDIFAVGIILWELLTGRRLFFGESDLATVRLVQAAKIPQAKKFNPDVPDELEVVLAKALARDPVDRYQSARDLATDLTNLLFAMGQPVSAFDVATLVEEVVSERNKKRVQGKVSIIGSLIEDAMMEFTSLKPGVSANIKTLHSATSSLAAQPLDALEDVKDWPSDFGLSAPAPPADDAHGNYSAGNLAALEEDTPSPPPRSAAKRGDAGGLASRREPAPPTQRRKSEAPTTAVPDKKSSGGAVTLVLVLVTLAGAAGAYFAGLIQ
ncbi:MAG: hypothetical protein RJA70_2225 [Pseudomonadota bacterium]|jgi:serine/threonine-protein kinase